MTAISITPSNGAVATWSYQNISYDPVLGNFSIDTPAPTSLQYNLDAIITDANPALINVITTRGGETQVEYNGNDKTLLLIASTEIKASYIDITMLNGSKFTHSLGFDGTALGNLTEAADSTTKIQFPTSTTDGSTSTPTGGDTFFAA